MILSILSALGGGLLRMLPELLGFLNKKADNAHELAMLDRQIAIEHAKGAEARATAQVQGDIDQVLALIQAQQAALVSQMQKTGIRIVDALNFLVRPLTTYILLTLYVLHKIGGALTLYAATDSVTQVFVQIYTQEDFALLSGILSFWFVSRVIDKK